MIVEKNKCTGCSACQAVCPVKAIELRSDGNGFYYPQIQMDKCIHCNLCKKTCPCLHVSVDSDIERINIIKNNDKTIRQLSSSGGLFSLLAESILTKNGYVCGCIMDENCRDAKHIITNDIKDIALMRGSKYIQSNLMDSFKVIKILLEEEAYVLFCGTPCQVAGLKLFLNKEYWNLLAIDFICHGVASPSVWSKYIDYIQSKKGSTVVQTEFRNKIHGWHKYSEKFVFQDGQIDTQIYSSSLFLKGYLENLFLRESCYSCGYKDNNYYSDITLSDFWGCDEVMPQIDDDTGVSLAIAHTKKGIEYIELIKTRAEIYEIDKANALKRNKSYYLPATSNLWRNNALKEFRTKPFEYVINKYCGTSFLPKIRRKISQINRRFYNG